MCHFSFDKVKKWQQALSMMISINWHRKWNGLAIIVDIMLENSATKLIMSRGKLPGQQAISTEYVWLPRDIFGS